MPLLWTKALLCKKENCEPEFIECHFNKSGETFMFEVDSHGGKRYHNEFLIVEIDEDAETGKVALEWHYNTPNEEQVDWITRQLKRLESLEM